MKDVTISCNNYVHLDLIYFFVHVGLILVQEGSLGYSNAQCICEFNTGIRKLSHYNEQPTTTTLK